jgi:hypothetical protein
MIRASQRYPAMNFNKILIVISFVWLLVSFMNRNAIPGDINFQPQIADEPIQSGTVKQAFHVAYEDVDYLVEPQFEYELYGMIVSYRHHDGNSRMHMRSNDHLNMLDVCVVWGDNAVGEHLSKIEFWNGIFTCNVKTNDRDAWTAFDMDKLSNNHLISDDDFIREQVSGVNIGDQIRVQGWLASYSNEGGGKRGTSTTRTDTGDGACETIYVEKFEIVEPAVSNWKRSMYGSLLLLMVSLFSYFRNPYRPFAND